MKANLTYLALLYKTDDGYDVVVPDFPGFTSAGKNVEDAYRNAVEGLSSHAELMVEAGLRIPSPRDVTMMNKKDDAWIVWDGAIHAFLPLLPPRNEYEKVTITVPARTLRAIDTVTKNKSDFFSKAAEEYFKSRHGWQKRTARKRA